MKWKIGNKVSTPEQIFDEIKEMVQPVGIVIFGADCGFKNEVCAECIKRLNVEYEKQIKRIRSGFGAGDDVDSYSTICYLHQGRDVVAIFDGDVSSDHERRHKIVVGLKESGAKSVVGIYAKRRLPILRATDNATNLKDSRSAKQAEAIEQNLPTADGLDCFIVVEE